MNATSTRIPAGQAEGLLNNIPLVEDLFESFFPVGTNVGRGLPWNLQSIGRVMKHFTVDGPDPLYPIMAVNASKVNEKELLCVGFGFAWRLWMHIQRDNGSRVNYVIKVQGSRLRKATTIILDPYVLSYPGHEPAKTAEVRFYVKDFYVSSDPWREILADLDTSLRLDGWNDGPTVSLHERLNRAAMYKAYTDPYETDIHHATVISGPNKALKVSDPYHIPGAPGVPQPDDEEVYSETDEGTMYVNDQPLN